MNELRSKLSLAAIALASSGTALAGAIGPAAPVATPVMGPWALGVMATLVAAVAYYIKKK